MENQRTEKGQVLVLVLLAVVGLMGFTALAVDGGYLYAEQRRAQNAADAAAYAAAMAAVDQEDFVQAAVNQAAINGFDNNGTTNTVIVHNPPVNGPYTGNPDYYQVLITSKIEPVFSQFVYNGPLEVTTEAVTRAEGTDQPTDGNAIHALTPNGLGIEFKGNVEVSVEGGNIYSNSDGKKSGVSGSVVVVENDIILRGTWDGDERGVDPDPLQNQPGQTVRPLPIPDCDVPAGTISGTTITPGKHGTISLQGGGGNTVYTMQPGMYCITGDLTVNGNVELRGTDVFLVMETGTIKLNGNGRVYLTRPDDLVDNAGNQWGGMLIYVLPGNTNEVFLSGGNQTTFAGTIYAPSSQCEVGGNAEAMALKSNIICNNVVFHGSAKITIDYKEPQNLQLAPMIELAE